MASRGSQLIPRVLRERRAGKYLWDVFVQGTTTAITGMIPAGALDPIGPALILPEVKEPKYWRDGDLWYADRERRYNLLLGLTTRPAFAINTKLVNPKEFRSFRDLLDPKWKSEIIVGRDPRGPGPGQSIFTFFYLNPQLGPGFIRALFEQNLTMLRNDRQSLDMLGQGKFEILLGPAETVTRDLIKRGVPIALIAPQQLKEGGPLSPGPASLMLVNKAPHPNAARVYINWILSKEGQTQFSRVTGIPSLRDDVPQDHIEAWRPPMKGGIPTYTEEAMAAKPLLLKLLRESMRK
ncbi:MAG: extracellular solute-binding protein [Deltaproteobacteria bacterium]|nr:extracellular solute-binding protein [Deltaproteobacteria bacterium]